MLNDVELNILQLIASSEDIKWNWYNLDRAMTIKKIEGTGHVARLVDNLIRAGLVDIIPQSPAGMDCYRVSEMGREYLKQLGIK
ncbi:hypothetical protein V5093_15555 [Enterobacter cancerogenus]|uniref:hypothetical protein n=1 Tax=Enterobacter cancerogenus TaxID=69218 RepID=UPI0030762C40